MRCSRRRIMGMIGAALAVSALVAVVRVSLVGFRHE
jgi:hypothetical protein